MSCERLKTNTENGTVAPRKGQNEVATADMWVQEKGQDLLQVK